MPLLFAAGLACTRRRIRARPDTAFYLASQTKSYVGLLAATLHRRNLFRLDATLADVWPSLALPGPRDAARVTMLQLLSHQLAVRDDDLVTRTSWSEPVPARDYPALLAAAQPREAGYCYDNLGYLVYAAALVTATGRDWQTWLHGELLGPLGLAGTSTHASDFALSHVASRHRKHGRRWRALPPKADALMHAAGGLVSSPADLATWLQVNLRRSAPGLEAEDFDRAHRPRIRAGSIDGPFRWTHYALGLQCGFVAGLPVLGHRGGYEGARSIAVFSPAARAGLALAVNADHGTRELLDDLAARFFGRLAQELQV